MSVIHISGNNNETNAVLDSNNAVLKDAEDISKNSITGLANLTITDISSNFLYTIDISGNNHESNTVQNSIDTTFMDGTNSLNNNTSTGF